MVHIAVRIFSDTFMGDLDQVTALTESQDLLGTDLDACRRFSLAEPGFIAENTLAYYRIDGTGIGICRDIKGAGRHTHAAPYTDFRIVDDSPLICLFVCVYKTRSQACRFIAVIALDLSVNRFVPLVRIIAVHHCECVLIGSALLCSSVERQFENGLVIERPGRGRQPLFLIAGRLATSASDTSRQVGEDSHALRITA
jgi:hypothetical protein